MEPHKAELKKTVESGKEERKRRFEIAKLEERIAPKCFSYRGRKYCGRGRWS